MLEGSGNIKRSKMVKKEQGQSSNAWWDHIGNALSFRRIQHRQDHCSNKRTIQQWLHKRGLP